MPAGFGVGYVCSSPRNYTYPEDDAWDQRRASSQQCGGALLCSTYTGANPTKARTADVRLSPYTRSKSYALSKVHQIQEMEMAEDTKKSLFYIHNRYESDTFECRLVLYQFEVVRETECYYFLINKQRVWKNSLGKYSLNEVDALHKALARARNYKKILMERLQMVHDFLGVIDRHYATKEMQDLNSFAALLHSLEPDAPIPPEAYLPLLQKQNGH